MNHPKGRLFIISAPSGSGKSTLLNMLIARQPQLKFSVSYTTRKPRPGEQTGRDYNFVSPDEFKNMIEAGEFLEWAKVFGCYYGTGRKWIEHQLEQGYDIVADLDVKGASQVKESKINSTFIFVAPPNMSELCRRLCSRKTESENEVVLRLEGAVKEIESRDLFDYLVINDDLKRATEELEAIIVYGRGTRMADAKDFWPSFFNSHNNADNK